MKKTIQGLVVITLLFLCSCDQVKPNYEGVLMQNFGKNGKSDFSLQKGTVWTMGLGTKLYQVPLWEQRFNFANNSDEAMKILHMKCADNTEILSHPVYSFKVIENRAIDVVFENKQLESGGDGFMESLIHNILNVKIYDLMKKESREWTTDSLMSNGGSLRFEKACETLVSKEFETKGLQLITFSCTLDFTEKVKERIDTRNQVNTNVTVIDQQIIEQRKKNELAQLQQDYNKIISAGLTNQILMDKFIERWDGKTPLYFNPFTFVKDVSK